MPNRRRRPARTLPELMHAGVGRVCPVLRPPRPQASRSRKSDRKKLVRVFPFISYAEVGFTFVPRATAVGEYCSDKAGYGNIPNRKVLLDIHPAKATCKIIAYAIQNALSIILETVRRPFIFQNIQSTLRESFA